MNLIKNKQTTLISQDFLFVQTSSFIETGVRHSIEKAIWVGLKGWGAPVLSAPTSHIPLPPQSLVIFTSPNLRAQTSQQLLPAGNFPMQLLIFYWDELPSPCALSTGFLLCKPCFSR